MSDHDMNPFSFIEKVVEDGEREEMLKRPLHEAMSYMKGAAMIIDVDPKLAAMMLRQAADRCDLYEARIQEVVK